MGKNWKRLSNGKVMVKGAGTFDALVGSRRQVWNRTAYKTQHGKKHLTRKHLKQNKAGRIVSIKRSSQATRKKNLGAYIALARKNKGKSFKKMSKSMVKGTRKSGKKKRSKRRK